MTLAYLSVLVLSGILLVRAAHWLVKGVGLMSSFLGWREFVLAFFVMAIAGSVPNLFVGIVSALNGIPELSFGDVVGNSVVNLTLVVAVAVLFGRPLSADSRLVQATSFLTISAAVLPVLLILDGTLSRGDGIVLILLFLCYSFWLFSRRRLLALSPDKDRPIEGPPLSSFRDFLKGLSWAVLGVLVLLIAASAAVESISFFSDLLRIPYAVMGILFVGLGNALPELYFAFVAARSGQNWMVLGELMGSIIVLTTLVLGIVALIAPIPVTHVSLFAIARFFLIIAALFFLLFTRTDRMITTREAVFLLFIYLAFVAVEGYFISPLAG